MKKAHMCGFLVPINSISLWSINSPSLTSSGHLRIEQLLLASQLVSYTASTEKP